VTVRRTSSASGTATAKLLLLAPTVYPFLQLARDVPGRSPNNEEQGPKAEKIISKEIRANETHKK
jgi:hypothetical protein